MKIGYARVSTADQNLDLQTDALKQAGCEKIFADHSVSGARAERPGLDEALEQIRKGDALISEGGRILRCTTSQICNLSFDKLGVTERLWRFIPLIEGGSVLRTSVASRD